MTSENSGVISRLRCRAAYKVSLRVPEANWTRLPACRRGSTCIHPANKKKKKETLLAHDGAQLKAVPLSPIRSAGVFPRAPLFPPRFRLFPGCYFGCTARQEGQLRGHRWHGSLRRRRGQKARARNTDLRGKRGKVRPEENWVGLPADQTPRLRFHRLLPAVAASLRGESSQATRRGPAGSWIAPPGALCRSAHYTYGAVLVVA